MRPLLVTLLLVALLVGCVHNVRPSPAPFMTRLDSLEARLDTMQTGVGVAAALAILGGGAGILAFVHLWNTWPGH